MANKTYSNFYLSNEIEDQFNSHLDLQQFCTIDNTLTDVSGMKRKINRYSATSATEKLEMGKGNTKKIEVAFAPEEYDIALAQNTFEYHDEEEMIDPMVVQVGIKQQGTDLFNTENADIFKEFEKAEIVVPVTSFDFDAFVDGVAAINIEEGDNNPAENAPQTFAFVNSSVAAEIRKNAKDLLKYVGSFVRTGYVGTIGGVHLYSKKDAKSTEICMGTKKAVTLFNKKGVQVEQKRDANTRTNDIIARKYYIAALTHADKAVKIIKGTAKVTTDTTFKSNKTYYAKLDNGYVVVGRTEEVTNPATAGYYEIS